MPVNQLSCFLGTKATDHFKFLEILTTENHLGFLYIRLKGVGTTTHES